MKRSIIATLCLLFAGWCCSASAADTNQTKPHHENITVWKNGKQVMLDVIVLPKDYKMPCTKKTALKKHDAHLRKVQDEGCVLCGMQSQETEVVLASTGTDPTNGLSQAKYKALNHLKNGNIVDETATSTWKNAPGLNYVVSPGVYDYYQPGWQGVLNVTLIIDVPKDCYGNCEVVYVSWDFEIASTSLLNAGAQPGTCYETKIGTTVCDWNVSPSCSNVPVYNWNSVDYIPKGITDVYEPSWQAFGLCERNDTPGAKWNCVLGIAPISPADSPTYCSYNP